MFLFLILVVGLTASASALNITSRDDWHARPPLSREPMSNPVPYVIIHHSAIPPACNTTDECILAMQTMQDMHQLANGWDDIGYSFAVGGDGNAYEGRGWSTVGAHAPGYNTESVGVCVIGNWMEELPPDRQLLTVHELIDYGVTLGMIAEDYILLGHREVKETQCPGDVLYEEVATWDHFVQI